MRYLPHTPEDIRAMLAVIGEPTIDALFAPIPVSAQLSRDLRLPGPLDEPRLMRHLSELAERNRGAKLLSFLGAGAYEHHIPPAVDQLLLRSELYTAYTPYQPEVSQGTLQAIFEFQTIVSEILGLPVANASMYDGASAAAEAVLMARRLTRRDKVVLSDGLHPHYRETIATYIQGLAGGKGTICPLPLGPDGCDDFATIETVDPSVAPSAWADEIACVVIAYPNFFGCVGDVRRAAAFCRERGAQLITVTTDPFALSVLESPGALGADIAVAEGQPLGLALQYGGPSAGLFACRDQRTYLQQMPGRIAGATVDQRGNTGYVLTLATREQHIRRERATSNICTNSGLCALAITIRMSMLGKSGFVEVGRQCLAKGDYLKRQIASLDGFDLVYPATPTFHEFCVRVRGGDAAETVLALENQGILAGFDLGRLEPARASELLIAVTELHTRADLDTFVAALNAT